MNLNIGRELAALQRLSVKELRDRYAEAFGEGTNANNKTWLIKRIAWRLQVLAEGDLSQRARRRAAELANDADLRLLPPRSRVAGASSDLSASEKPDDRLPPPGNILTRPYKGRIVRV